ncbi:hypothetical protein CRUP_005098 [Coryphaenoides rupestris]|nr:hypothetical protein CRUP_005098 [Coryphaenoides rupestris]
MDTERSPVVHRNSSFGSQACVRTPTRRVRTEEERSSPVNLPASLQRPAAGDTSQRQRMSIYAMFVFDQENFQGRCVEISGECMNLTITLPTLSVKP